MCLHGDTSKAFRIIQCGVVQIQENHFNIWASSWGFFKDTLESKSPVFIGVVFTVVWDF